MKKEIIQHLFAYIFLILGMGVFVVGMFFTWQIPQQQRWVIAGGCCFYFAWGLITHVKTQKLTKKVVYEYASIATLAAVVLLLLTLG